MEPQFISLSEQVSLHGLYRANEIAYIEGDRSVDWLTLNRNANQIAIALTNLGVQPGDRVAMLYGCQIEAFEVLIGIWRAGAAFAPLSPMLTAELVSSLGSDVGAKILISGNEFSAIAEEAAALSDLDHYSGASLLDHKSDGNVVSVRNQPDELSNVIYSSGTTGQPKGIAINHSARASLASAQGAAMGFTPNSTAYLAIPPHSNGAFLMWGTALYFGTKTVLQPKFDVEDFINIVQRWRPTHGFVVPTMCHALLNHPEIEKIGLECFECALTGGAPMPEALKREMLRLTENGFAELWGLSEGLATYIAPGEMTGRYRSVGRPLSGTEIHLLDTDSNELTKDGVGEIIGRSTYLMDGYWDRPEASREIEWISPEELTYIRTGDIGQIDEEGYLTIRGRIKDMLISGGLNVYPVDIEMEFLKCDEVEAAAVVGVPHEKWGETPIAFLNILPGSEFDKNFVMKNVNERLAKHQRVSDVVIWEGEFPRNALGKTVKYEMRDAYLNDTQKGA